MRFKTDENLPEEFAQALRDAGWDAVSVYEQELGGHVDQQIASICAAESRILVTLDVGFSNIRLYPVSGSPGIIVLRLRRQDKTHVLEVARKLAMRLRMRALEQELWIVDEQRVRIRAASADESR